MGKQNLANQAEQRADPEREQKAGIQGLRVWGKRRKMRAEGEVEEQGQRTNRQTLLAACVRCP